MEPNRPKRTKATQVTKRPGESKTTNVELLGEMTKCFNNSIATKEVASILSNALDEQEMARVLQWFRRANWNKQNEANKNKRWF